MQRRELLKLLSTAALAGCGTGRIEPGADVKSLKIVVVGAGIIGASIAYQLAKSGASVRVIDKSGPATHASRGTFAWINATWAKQPKHYHSLSQDGVASWRTLQQELDLPVRWGGSLEWFDTAERQQKLFAQIAEQVAWGEPARIIGAQEVAALEPTLKFPAQTFAAFSPNDGAVDPIQATRRLLAAAQELGAQLDYPNELTGVTMSGDRLRSIQTSNGTITADRLVLATGAAADIPNKYAGVDIPQRTTPGVIAVSKPMPRRLNRIVATADVHIHQRDDGRFIVGESTSVWANQAHTIRLQRQPNSFPAPALAQEHGKRMLAKAEKILPLITNALIDDAYIGWRPLPIDGHPVIGSATSRPDVYLAIMHSGVSLAPIVGQLVAHEIIHNTKLGTLAKFRPERSFTTVKRY